MAKKTTTSIDAIQSIIVNLDLIDNNTGQIPGVKPNPREMTDMEYRKLVKSLRRDASYTAICELKVYPFNGRWVAIGGNMRLKAMRELQWPVAIVKPIPVETDAPTLNRYILLDNAHFGRWDFDSLANLYSLDLIDDMNIHIPPKPLLDEEESDESDPVNDRPDNHLPKNTDGISFILSPLQAEFIRKNVFEMKAMLATSSKKFTNDNENANAIYQIIREWLVLYRPYEEVTNIACES